MNYGVHAIMYYYYNLTARGYRPKWDGLVTTLQISQMFVGMGVCAAVFYFQTIVSATGRGCAARNQGPGTRRAWNAIGA